jgi:hypothetical protein
MKNGQLSLRFRIIHHEVTYDSGNGMAADCAGRCDWGSPHPNSPTSTLKRQEDDQRCRAGSPQERRLAAWFDWQTTLLKHQ